MKPIHNRIVPQIIASLFLAGALSSGAGESRFVVTGDVLDNIANAVELAGGKIHEKLQYHQAFTATLNDHAAAAIQRRFGPGTVLEKDGIASLRVPREHAGQAAGGSGGKPVPQNPQSITWGISAVNAPSAWPITKGAGVKVGILDTGIQKTHPDLQANIIGGATFVGSKWEDDNGHGTHVAGIIAAADNAIGVIGVAPAASLFIVKVLNRNGVGFNSAVAEGVRSCIANGVHVINMSLESDTDTTLVREAITDAHNAGIVLVAAAGNGGLPEVSYPARYPEVLAVSALFNYGGGRYGIAAYSNHGLEIDFTAPGNLTYSTWTGSGYTALSGTSQAAPHVSGAVALMLASGNLDLVARDIGLLPEQQGDGLIDALLTVQPPPPPAP